MNREYRMNLNRLQGGKINNTEKGLHVKLKRRQILASVEDTIRRGKYEHNKSRTNMTTKSTKFTLPQLAECTTMGNLYSRHPELKKWSEIFSLLGISERNVERLYKTFKRIDLDDSLTICLHEMITHIGLEDNAYSRRIFSIFDNDGNNSVDFGEFVVVMWNYCTLAQSSFVKFCFDLYDCDHSGILESSELQQMLLDIYGPSYTSNKHALIINNKLSRNRRLVYDSTLFADFVASHPALLFPAFSAQDRIKDRIMGKGFWKRLKKHRESANELVTMRKLRILLHQANAASRRRKAPVVYVSSIPPLRSNKVSPSAYLANSSTASMVSRDVSGSAKPIRRSFDVSLQSINRSPTETASSSTAVSPRAIAPAGSQSRDYAKGSTKSQKLNQLAIQYALEKIHSTLDEPNNLPQHQPPDAFDNQKKVVHLRKSMRSVSVRPSNRQ